MTICGDMFKIRCSAIGSIMAGKVGLSAVQEKKRFELQSRQNESAQGFAKPLTAKMEDELQKLTDTQNWPDLPAGVKTYCQAWLKEKLYGRRKEIDSKYLDKGNACEEASIEFLNSQLLDDYKKNEQYFENDYMTGTPDIVSQGLVIDMKNSWDAFTFPLFDYGIKNKDYYYQLQGYMHLTGQYNSLLCYTLMNAPWHLVLREANFNAKGSDLDFDKVLEQTHALMTYDDIPDHLRIKKLPCKYDQEVITKIEERVTMCRTYINTIIEEIEDAK